MSSFRSRRWSRRSLSGRPKRKVELALAGFYGALAVPAIPTFLVAADWMIFPGNTNWPVPLSGAIDTVPELTLVHTRGILNYQTGPIGISVESTFAVGLLEWESIRTTAPAAADVPNPIIHGADWIWHVSVPISKNVSGVSQMQAGSTVADSILQSKGMRKLPQNSGIIAVMAVGGVSGSQGHTIAMGVEFQFRLKLP